MKILAPGMYEDKNGDLHFSIPDICASLGLEYNEKNKAKVEAFVAQMIKNNSPDGVKVITQPACPECGLVGAGEHKSWCTYIK